MKGTIEGEALPAQNHGSREVLRRLFACLLAFSKGGSWEYQGMREVARAAPDRSGRQSGARKLRRHCLGGWGEAGSQKKALPKDECWRVELERFIIKASNNRKGATTVVCVKQGAELLSLVC